MKVMVRVDVEQHVRGEAARQLAEQGTRSVKRCASCPNTRSPKSTETTEGRDAVW